MDNGEVRVTVTLPGKQEWQGYIPVRTHGDSTQRQIESIIRDAICDLSKLYICLPVKSAE